MRPDQRATAEGILFTDQYQLTMAQLYFKLGHARAIVRISIIFFARRPGLRHA